jgi:transposase-like protein
MNTKAPTSLIEAVRFFSDLDVCHAKMEAVKWPDGVVTCPKCGGTKIGRIASRRMYQCKDCRKQFSVKVGTIFEDSPLGLDKWFVAVWVIVNAKNGISSYEIGRALGISQKSAWFMLHRIRTAMKTGSFEKFTGVCESDETYIGGKAKNMHMSRRQERIGGRGSVGKDIVHGVLMRAKDRNESKVRAQVVPNATVYTDALQSYNALPVHYVHDTIDHAFEYVRGAVHTNGMENFWALFKRAIKGTYVAIDAPHLQRYVDEEVFRFNERKKTDGERFNTVMPGVVGKRLTYKELIGKSETPPCP